jgi:TetR/AcrR family transcriptional regulator, transcriptional repressor for nem operon
LGTKGEQTRDMILREASRLFNEKGMAGLSMSEILKVTGLQKGGLYNHFESKEELAIEAFDYAVDLVRKRFQSRLAGKATAMEQLHAIIETFRGYYDDPPIAGGCPLMNTSVESDDSNPRLRERARQATEGNISAMAAIVKAGVKRGEFRPDVKPAEVACILLSTFEGALMLSKLFNSPAYLSQAADFMKEYVNGLQPR